METFYPVLYMAITFAITVFSVVVVIKLKNGVADIESKLTGIWVNESQSMRIVLHHLDSIFQGEVVWVSSVQPTNNILGFKMIRDLEVKKLVQGSRGIYADPLSGVEKPFQMWLQGGGRLTFTVIDKVNGKDKIVKQESWFRL